MIKSILQIISQLLISQKPKDSSNQQVLETKPEQKPQVVSEPPKRRTINKDGLDLVKSFEGLRLESYLCPAKVWTIGYGSTGSDIGPGLSWTLEQAEARLKKDLETFEKGVEGLIKTKITDNQFSALVCFTYNVGLGAFGRSTLLKTLNAGNHQDAANEFLRWNKAGGKELAGLTRRRQAERELFLKSLV
jgi:lysozyme